MATGGRVRATQCVIGICVSLACAGTARAQVLDAKGVPITFEAISIKESSGNRISDGWQGARFTVGDLPLRNFLTMAYGIPFHETASLPEWTRTTTYLIRAVASRAPDPSEQGLFVRALVEQRFGVRARTEMQEQPMYTLSLARADGRLGSGFTPSAVDCMPPPPTAGGQRPVPAPAACSFNMNLVTGLYTRTGVGVPVLADMLSIVLSQPIVDKTGLSGLFDIDLKFRPMSVVAADAGADLAPDLFTALQEQLGLKLEPGRGSFPRVVFDRLERPTPD